MLPSREHLKLNTQRSSGSFLLSSPGSAGPWSNKAKSGGGGGGERLAQPPVVANPSSPMTQESSLVQIRGLIMVARQSPVSGVVKPGTEA